MTAQVKEVVKLEPPFLLGPHQANSQVGIWG